MGFINEADVQRLMQNEELMAEVAKAIIEDPDTMDSLADDIADKLDDALEDSLELKNQIVAAAVSNPKFKTRLAQKLTRSLS